jgi:hypothetical protein
VPAISAGPFSGEDRPGEQCDYLLFPHDPGEMGLWGIPTGNPDGSLNEKEIFDD